MSNDAAKKCGGKKRHSSERKAAEIAKVWQKRTGVAMKGYKCSYCPYWHIGAVKVHEDEHHAQPRRRRFLRDEQPLEEFVSLPVRPLMKKMEKAFAQMKQPVMVEEVPVEPQIPSHFMLKPVPAASDTLRRNYYCSPAHYPGDRPSLQAEDARDR